LQNGHSSQETAVSSLVREKAFLFEVLIMLQGAGAIHAFEAAPLAGGTFGGVIEE
jgi:hypothetical protein